MTTTHTPRAGDIFLRHSPGPIGAAIRTIIQSEWNHAGICVVAGQIVEALSHGAQVNPLPSYPVLWIRPPLTTKQQVMASAVALGFARDGIGYGYPDIFALGLKQYGIHSKLIDARIARSDRMICSQLVDAALTRAGLKVFTDGREPQDVTPGNLGTLAIESGWPMWYAKGTS